MVGVVFYLPFLILFNDKSKILVNHSAFQSLKSTILTEASNSFSLVFVKYNWKQKAKNVSTSEHHSTQTVLVQNSREENKFKALLRPS